jgi:hypothetical protein
MLYLGLLHYTGEDLPNRYDRNTKVESATPRRDRRLRQRGGGG